MKNDIAEAIRAHITIPDHISAMASACAYDLMNGPSFARKPDSGNWEDFTVDDFASFPEDLDGEVVETYTGKPGEMLREFILTLPSSLYIDTDAGCVMESEPEGEWLNSETLEPCDSDDDNAEWFEPSDYAEIDHQDIIEALLGRTIAREFC